MAVDPRQTCLRLEDRALAEDPCSAVDPARLCRPLGQVQVEAEDPCSGVGPARVVPLQGRALGEVEGLCQAEDPCLAGDLVRVGPLQEGLDLGEAADPYLVADPVHAGQGQADEVAPCREVVVDPCREEVVDPCSGVDPGVFFARTSAPGQGNQKN